MNELIFKGYLDKKEYGHLWRKMRMPLIIYHVSALIVAAVLAFCLGLILRDDDLLPYKIALIVVISLVVLSIGPASFFIITTGGFPPYGEVEVYKKDQNSIFITWIDVNKTSSKAIKFNEVKIVNDHLYVYESRRNFAFLPKELYPLLKQSTET